MMPKVHDKIEERRWEEVGREGGDFLRRKTVEIYELHSCFIFHVFFFIQSDGCFKATETLAKMYRYRLKIACGVYICVS